MKLTDDDKRVLDERNFPEKIKKMIEDMPKDDIMKIHDFAEYVLVKEKVKEADMKSRAKEKLTDKEISEIAKIGSFEGKMTEYFDYAKETDYLIANYKWKRDNNLNEKKYELTGITIEVNGQTLYRIRALKDFSDGFSKVKKGDLGGYIEKEKNLSHEGNCWVGEDAKVYSEAKVYDNARVYGNAEVSGFAEVYKSARVYGNAIVLDNVKVFDNAKVYGDACISGSAKVYDKAEITDEARVFGHANVFENAEVSGASYVSDDTMVRGNAQVYDRAEVYDDAYVYGNAMVYGDARVYENAEVYGDAEIYGNALVFGEAKVSGDARVSGEAWVCGCTKIYGDAKAEGEAVISKGEISKGTIDGSKSRRIRGFYGK